jgi:hypothetical protein
MERLGSSLSHAMKVVDLNDDGRHERCQRVGLSMHSVDRVVD